MQSEAITAIHNRLEQIEATVDRVDAMITLEDVAQDLVPGEIPGLPFNTNDAITTFMDDEELVYRLARMFLRDERFDAGLPARMVTSLFTPDYRLDHNWPPQNTTTDRPRNIPLILVTFMLRIVRALALKAGKAFDRGAIIAEFQKRMQKRYVREELGEQEDDDTDGGGGGAGPSQGGNPGGNPTQGGGGAPQNPPGQGGAGAGTSTHQDNQGAGEGNRSGRQAKGRRRPEYDPRLSSTVADSGYGTRSSDSVFDLSDISDAVPEEFFDAIQVNKIGLEIDNSCTMHAL